MQPGTGLLIKTRRGCGGEGPRTDKMLGRFSEMRLFLLGFVRSLWASVSRKILSANNRAVRDVRWPLDFPTLLFIIGKVADVLTPYPAPTHIF